MIASSRRLGHNPVPARRPRGTPLLAGLLSLSLCITPAVLLTGCGSGEKRLDAAGPPIELGGRRFRVQIARDGDDFRGSEDQRFGPRPYIRQVTIDGNTFLGRLGLADEFGIDGQGVLGYDLARPGQSFLKIGVGELRKPEAASDRAGDDEGETGSEDYFFGRRYAVVELVEPDFTVLGEDRFRVVTADALPDNRYAYRLRQDYFIERATGLVAVEHELQNLGAEPIEFEHYNHAQISFNGHGLDEAYEVVTDFDVIDRDDPDATARRSLRPLENKTREEKRKARSWYVLSLEPASAADNGVRITHDDQPHEAVLRGNFPVGRFAIYVDTHGVCPELFYRERIAPGETATWTRYFYFRIPGRRF